MEARDTHAVAHAVAHADEEGVRASLSGLSGQNLVAEANNVHNGTPLIVIATRRGHIESARALVAAGADVDLEDEISGCTAFWSACEREHNDIAKFLLPLSDRHRTRPNVYGWTPLDMLLKRASTDESLMNGTKLESEQPYVEAFQAVVQGNLPLVKMLMDRCLFSASDKGKLLHAALDAGFNRVVDCLLDYDADMGMTDHIGNSVLHKMSPLVGYLLKRSGPLLVNVRNSKGQTPLHVWVKEGNYFIVKKLLKNGADPSICDHFGWSPVRYIYWYHGARKAAILWLLNHPSFVAESSVGTNHEEKKQGFNFGNFGLPIRRSIAKQRYSLALVEMSSDGSFDEKLWQMIIAMDVLGFVALIRSQGTISDSSRRGVLTRILLYSVKGRLQGFVALCLQHGASLRGRSPEGESALAIAIANGDVEILKLVFEHDREILADFPSAIVRCPNMETLEFLGSCDADLDAVDDFGNTLLSNLAYKVEKEGKYSEIARMISYLVERNCSLTKANRFGWNVVDVALSHIHRHPARHEILSAAGIDAKNPLRILWDAIHVGDFDRIVSAFRLADLRKSALISSSAVGKMLVYCINSSKATIILLELMKRGPNTFVRSFKGDTIISALGSEKCQVDQFVAIVNAGGDIGCDSMLGGTPLLVRKLMTYSSLSYDAPLLTPLIRANRQLLGCYSGGQNLLHWAIANGLDDVTEILVHENPSLAHQAGSDGVTPFMSSLSHNDFAGKDMAKIVVDLLSQDTTGVVEMKERSKFWDDIHLAHERGYFDSKIRSAIQHRLDIDGALLFRFSVDNSDLDLLSLLSLSTKNISQLSSCLAVSPLDATEDIDCALLLVQMMRLDKKPFDGETHFELFGSETLGPWFQQPEAVQLLLKAGTRFLPLDPCEPLLPRLGDTSLVKGVTDIDVCLSYTRNDEGVSMFEELLLEKVVEPSLKPAGLEMGDVEYTLQFLSDSASMPPWPHNRSLRQLVLKSALESGQVRIVENAIDNGIAFGNWLWDFCFSSTLEKDECLGLVLSTEQFKASMLVLSSGALHELLRSFLVTGRTMAFSTLLIQTQSPEERTPNRHRDEVPDSPSEVQGSDIELSDILSLGCFEANRNRAELLRLAVSLSNEKIVELLLTAGSSPIVKNENGWSAIHVALHEGKYSLLQLLARSASESDHQEIQKIILLWRALDTYPMEDSAFKDCDVSPDILGMVVHSALCINPQAFPILKPSADMSARDADGRTLVEVAVQKERLHILDELLQMSDTQSDEEWSSLLEWTFPNPSLLSVVLHNIPIHRRRSVFSRNFRYLMEEGRRTDSIQLLLEYGCDPNMAVSGQTLLSNRIANDDFGSVLTLVAAGANIRIRDSSGDLPISVAMKQAHIPVDVVKALIPAKRTGYDESSMLEVEVRDRRGMTMFHQLILTCSNREVSATEALADAMIDAYSEDKALLARKVLERDIEGKTCLHLSLAKIGSLKKLALSDPANRDHHIKEANFLRNLSLSLGASLTYVENDLKLDRQKLLTHSDRAGDTILSLAEDSGVTGIMALPFVQEYVQNHLWSKFVRWDYLTEVILYCAFATAYTCFVALSFSLAWSDSSEALPFEVVLWLTGLYFLSKEVAEFRYLGKKTLNVTHWMRDINWAPRWLRKPRKILIFAYLAELSNVVDALLFTVLLGCLVGRRAATSHASHGFRYLFGLSGLLVYFKLAIYGKQHIRLGPLLKMVQEMLADVLWFIFLYFTVLMGFSASFFVINGQETKDDDAEGVQQFKSLGDTLMFLLEAFFGNFEFSALDDDHSWINRALFIVYLVMTFVLLLNLLIAMLNSSYARIEKQAFEQWMHDRVILCLRTEKLRLSSAQKASKEAESIQYLKEHRLNFSATLTKLEFYSKSLRRDGDDKWRGGQRDLLREVDDLKAQFKLFSEQISAQ